MAKRGKTNWVRLALEEMLHRAYNQAQGSIPDHETPVDEPVRDITPLKRSLRIVVDDDLHGRLYIPHYWAIYVHDGYRPNGYFQASQKTFLVYYRRPQDDPRLNNGEMPERWDQVRHLTKEQFKRLLLENQEAYRRGQEPIAYIKQFLPGKKGYKFFDNDVGFSGFLQEANAGAGPIVRQGILDEFKDILNIKDTATAVLGF